MEWVIGIIAVVLFVGWLMHLADKRKRERLMAKYNDEEIVEMLMQRKIWVGMDREQLIDSWGQPVDIDERVLKTKVSHTYKYNQEGKNRFRDRVKLDDGIVIGWDSR